MSKLNKKMKQLHKEFVKLNGSEPRYADVKVKFDGDDEVCDCIIKMKDYDPKNTENDVDDNNVIYYVDGITGLCNCDADGFDIVDINGFGDVY